MNIVQAALKPIIILLADASEDDSRSIRDLLADMTDIAMQVEWVSTYDAAYTALTQGQHDVCLLDYGLSGRRGLELLQALPADNLVPIIFLMGTEDHQVDMAAARAGAADYLVKKHINAPLLERSLRYAIERKKTEAALLHAQRFAQATVDALPGYIAVLDSRGTIIAVNAGWREFAASNGFIGADSGIGTNYLEVCEQSDEADGRAAAACIRAVMAGEEPISAVEYPCDSPTARQWFRVSATRFPGEGPLHVVVAHENITERKLAAQQFEVHSHLLNVIGQAVVVTDSVGKITYWNAFAAKLYGWSAAEVLGRNILEVTPPDTTQKQATEILACLSRGESWSGEFLVQKRDGTKFPAYVTDTPVLDQAGDVVSIIGTSLDITERKSAEETATLLAAVVESSEDAIISKTLDGIITSWNAGAENLYGYTAQEAIGRSVSFLAPSELSKEMQELLKKIEHGEQIKQYETVRVRKDGSRVDISLSISPLKNAEGVLIGASSIKRDITERKQAEATLRDSNERFLQLANNIGDVFWVRSPDMSELRYISPAFEHIWGRSLESLYANPQQWSEFVVPEDREYALGIFSKLQRDARSASCEHRIMRPDGEIRWIYTRGFQVRNDAGELMCLTGVASDITERKRVEERLLRSEANLIKAQQMSHLGSWELDLGNSEDFNANSLRWSDELFRIFGYKPGEVEVSNDIFFQAVHPDDRETVSRTMQESLQSGNPYSIQHRIILPDGRERIVQSRGEILTNEETGQLVKVIGLGQDITESKQAENSLFESRQRLVLATESAHIGIWDWDVVENKMVWDAQMFALYGIREQDVGSAYDAWKNGLHPEDRERAEADLHAALEGSRDFDTQFRVVWPTGEVRHVEAHAMVQRAENGTALRMIGVNWDVTERQRAEESLRESEERFSGAFEYAPIGIALVSPEGQWLKVNHALCNLLGYSQQELLVRTFQDITHPDDLEADLENVHRLLAGDIHSYQMEKRYFHSRGDLVSVSLSVSLVRDGEGQPLYFISQIQDVTERKRTEEALRRSEALFRTLINSSWDAFQLVDPNGRIGYESPSVTQILGYEPEEMIGRNASEFVHPDDVERAMTTGMAFLDSPGAQRTVILRVRHKNGSWRWVESFEVNLLDHPDVGAVAVNYHDITERKEAEEERDRFFTLSLDMLCIADHNGYFKRLNPAFETTLGYSNAELMGKPFLEWVHPDDRAATLDVMKEIDAGGSTLEFVNRYHCRDGSYRWLSWVSAPFEDSIYAAAHDVTSLKNAEAALQKSNDDLELRVKERTAQLESQVLERERAEREVRAQARQHEAVADLGRRALLDLDTLLEGTVALVASTLGADICSFWERLPGSDTLRFRAGIGLNEQMKSALDKQVGDNTQIGYTAFLSEPVFTGDLSQETRFGPALYLLDMGITSLITVPVHNEVLYGVLAVCSPRRQKFSQNEIHFLQVVANVLASAISHKHAEAEILQLNNSLQAVNESLRVENIERQMTMETLRQVADALQLSKEEAERAMQEANAANLAKSEFLSRMSHELRTPMNAILGYGQILEMRHHTPDIREPVEAILKAGRHLLDLINEVLDISRIEAGHLSLSLEPVPVSSTTRIALGLVRPLSTMRGIQIVNEDSASHAERYIFADQQRIKQVLVNLLSNAIKYNREGGQVFVSTTIVPGESVKYSHYGNIECSGKMRFSVRDTGSGIDSNDFSKIFLPFERLGAERTGVEGTGIGLSLCKRLVEAMNGEIGVNSVRGIGSTFWVELPLVSTASDIGIAVEKPSLLSDAALKQEGQDAPEDSLTILYIEDNRSNFAVIKHSLALQKRAINLLGAEQGSVGLDLARSHQPDLILLDLHLPDIMGDVVLQRLQAEPSTRAIPVIILSADATPRQIERLLAAGATAYLTKPLDLNQFFSVVEQTLDEMET